MLGGVWEPCFANTRSNWGDLILPDKRRKGRRREKKKKRRGGRKEGEGNIRQPKAEIAFGLPS